MNRVRPCALGGIQNRRDVEIRIDVHRLIRRSDVQRIAIEAGVYGDCVDADCAARPHNAYRDLGSVCDQNAPEAFHRRQAIIAGSELIVEPWTAAGYDMAVRDVKRPEDLRSFRWFGPDTMRGFSHRSRMRQLGFNGEDFIGKPVIAIINTWSEINPCHAHLRERAETVKRGVWQAGGFPVEFPAFSITETYMKPSPMVYRNLLAMETEEALRSLPVDGAVLMGGCDKTTPGLLMGAISMNLPAIYLPGGPMLRGNWRGQPLGSGTDLRKFWTERCAGTLSEEEWNSMEDGIARSPG